MHFINYFAFCTLHVLTSFPKTQGDYWNTAGSMYNYVVDTSCTFMSECCRPPFVRKADAVKELNKELKKRFFGQHIAVKAVMTALDAHLSDENPSKPLVLSFHGWGGSGKTYLSQLIATALYEKGTDSNYTRVYLASLDFPPDEEKIPEYKDKLQRDIEKTLKSCEHALIIFEEVDDIPSKIFDSLVAFLDRQKLNSLNGISHKKAIYIFLSNVGSITIADNTLKTWQEGKPREDLTISDFHEAVAKEAFNTKNTGFTKSKIIEKSLIDYYIPFLPMEEKHVIECAKAELERQNFLLEPGLIAKNLTYWPSDLKLYSNTGCKRVETVIKNYISASKFQKEEL